MASKSKYVYTESIDIVGALFKDKNDDWFINVEKNDEITSIKVEDILIKSIGKNINLKVIDEVVLA